MSGSTEERVVEMTFKGDSFTSDVKIAISAIGALVSSLGKLKGTGGENGIDDISNSAKKFSLAGVESGIQSLSSKFTTLGIVGITAISNIANRAVNAGISIAKALVIDPIKEGFENYQSQINSTKTIMANSGASIGVVTAKLNELNVYANQTVYSFNDMTQAIGLFSAAGVPLTQAVGAIKGMGNAAALSGAGVTQLQSAMYQMSQALSGGVIHLQDWNSLQQANVASGKNFQQVFEDTSASMGKNVDSLVKAQGGFRNSLQKGWLTSDVFTKAMNVMAGQIDKTTGKTVAYSVAQLQAMGYTEAQAKNLNRLSAAAISSATQIRTFTQLTDTLKDEVATSWAAVFKVLVGNLPEAATLFTNLHTVLENIFTSPVYALANFLQKLKSLGALDLVIQSVVDVFKALSAIFKVLSQAWKEVFPPVSVDQVGLLIQRFEEFTASLIPSNKALGEFRSVFVGVFSILKIGVDVILAVVKGLGIMGSAAAGTGGSVLSVTARVGDFIDKIRLAIEKGGDLTKFFTTLGTILSLPIKAITIMINSLGGFAGILDKVIKVLAPFTLKVEQAFSGFFGAVAKGIESGNIESVEKIINEALLGGVLVQVKSFIANLGKDTGGDKKTGFLDTIKESFEQLTGSLKTMQTTLKSKTLEAIAIAVALLSASLIALSFVNVKNLSKSLGAITGLFLDLIGALAIVTKVSGSTGVVKMAVIAGAMNLLATSILILVGAVAILAQFSWSQLERGVSAIAVLLVLLVGATTLMGANAKGTISAAYAMEVMAVALNLMAIAVGKFGKMNIGTIVKGVASIAVLLAEMALFNQFGGKQSLQTATSMVILGGALLIIAKAIATIGSLPTENLVKGLTGIASALLIIGLAMLLMPPDMLVTAAALLVVSGSLVILAQAMTTMGGMSWDQIAKGLVTLAGALTLIVVAMLLMTGALPGAAALLVIAGALAILTPILVSLSQLGWEGIAVALVALAGAFVIIGAAGLLLGPLVPVLLGIGVAITLMGVGLLAAGAGIALFAVGITALAVAITGSGLAILSFVTSVLALIPATFAAIGKGIVSFAVAIGQGAPALINAFVAILSALLKAIITVVPLAVKAFETILNALLAIIPTYVPRVIVVILGLLLALIVAIGSYAGRFASAGATVVVNFLNGLAHQIPRMATAAANVVIAFINAIGTQTLRIAKAGENMIINLINGIANTIRSDTPRLNAAGANLAGAIVDGMTGGLASEAGGFLSSISNLGSEAVSTFKKAIRSLSPSKAFADAGETIPQGLVVGVNKQAGNFNDAITNLGESSLSAITASLSSVSDIVNANMNLNPTITPVLDLTQAQKGFGQLNSLSKNQLITATASTNKATSISSTNAAAAASLGTTAQGDSNSVSFVQNNYSPTALSATEIYRQTNNQLSKVRKAINANAS